jgi:uncharacterized protein GlcG (DUF336 family)
MSLVPRREMASKNDGSNWRRSLSASTAKQMVDAAVAAATATAVCVTVVAVDDSGVVKVMRRMDGAPLVSVQTAMDKAHAAVAVEMPPDEFYAAIETDTAAVAAFAARPGMALIGGGLPLLVRGEVVGGLGVAGAMTGAEHRRIAELAVERAESSVLDGGDLP